MRILVVDDEQAVRSALRRALSLDGYQVELAANGELAIELVDSRPPDALVLDVLMPGLDGLEVCRRLRAGGNRTPVLLLTARDAVAEELAFADLVLNRATREVHRGERLIELTQTEFLLLELFLLNPRQVLERSTIFERVWGFDFGLSSNSLEVYVSYLRRKLEARGEPRLVQTVRGVGYALREPRESV